jgi:hypothetical protein
LKKKEVLMADVQQAHLKPGKWYVTVTDPDDPAKTSRHGPFHTPQEAEQWIKNHGADQRGKLEVWQCPPG